ncbi:predicted protein [Histoplasma capsulatum G186AR]|uniref:Uncharacterized protein n=1 Tax=Ajellomyces capsulatus (strain G186AR / H82 / ATCC MYA-2454 / RMSCC 2432) TaxID=447093 RepID=C0NI81_AJECG|nr:uncharacterized protein HCBG_03053 [Histoplasma capsulatum G186AR]EEH09516.1 predicted protein [Histoplasma capsulatum G186AR]
MHAASRSIIHNKQMTGHDHPSIRRGGLITLITAQEAKRSSPAAACGVRGSQPEPAPAPAPAPGPGPGLPTLLFLWIVVLPQTPVQHDMILKTLSPASVSALIEVSIHSHLSDALASSFFQIFPWGVIVLESFGSICFSLISPARDGQGVAG